MQLDTGQWIVIIISAILIAGYIGGYSYNRRVAQKVVEWLHTGLSQWGAVTAGEPLGGLTTGGSLNVLNASSPFQRIETIFLLEPRENLIFWFFDRLRSRQDELILKIGLRSVPNSDTSIEAGFPRDKNFQQALTDNKNGFSSPQTIGRLKFALASKKTAPDERTRHFLEKYAGSLTRLSIQRQYPHIFIRAHLKPLLNQPAQILLDAISELSAKGQD